MPTILCSRCDKPTYKRPRDIAASKSGKLYCSLSCCGLDNRNVKRFCAVCDKPLVSWARRVTCSPKCEGVRRRDTRYVRSGNKTAATRRQGLISKRGSQCERCGYSDVPEILVSHHVIRRADGGSDDWDNLELLCPNCHSLHHLLESDKV